MKERIEIYDDLVPLSIQNSIESLITSDNVTWSYKRNIVNSNDQNLPYIPGFSHSLINSNQKNISDNFVWSCLQPLYSLTNHIELNIDKIIRSRLFLQVPSNIDLRLDPHIDMDEPHLVCLYYINDSDGDTIFFNKNNIIKEVSPKKGRIALFDGSIEHSAGIPKTFPRFILNINFTTCDEAIPSTWISYK